MNYFKKLSSVMLVILMLVSIIPTTIFAEDESKKMSAEFRSYLTDGKLVLNFPKPSSKNDGYADMVATYYEDNMNALYLHDENGKPAFSDDLSKATPSLWNNAEQRAERHTVDVVWNYDKDVQKAAQAIVNKFPKDNSNKTYFYLYDLEFMNYLAFNTTTAERQDEMANYSAEVKEVTKNTNFSLKIDSRMGGNGPFYTYRSGITAVVHRDTVYSFPNGIYIQANHVIYVPESTPNDRASLMKAAQKRVDEYIGKGVIKFTDNGDTVAQLYQEEIATLETYLAKEQQQLAELEATLAAELAKDPAEQNQSLIDNTTQYIIWQKDSVSSSKNAVNYAKEMYNNGRYKLDFLRNAAGDFMFDVAVAGKKDDVIRKFVIVKDDSMLSIPKYKNVDFSTNVSISTDSSEVPLDAIIKVERISNGKEHDRICGVLKSNDNEMFDIELFSGSIDDYITKLKNGKFKVQLPIPKKYKGKELVVYYVDANGKTTAYNVTVKNGFAVFETDHFSIYTLATLPKNNSSTQGTPEDNSSTPSTPEDDLSTPNTPENNNTSSSVGNNDGSPIWLIPFIIILGVILVVVIFIIVKRKTNK